MSSCCARRSRISEIGSDWRTPSRRECIALRCSPSCGYGTSSLRLTVCGKGMGMGRQGHWRETNLRKVKRKRGSRTKAIRARTMRDPESKTERNPGRDRPAPNLPPAQRCGPRRARLQGTSGAWCRGIELGHEDPRRTAVSQHSLPACFLVPQIRLAPRVPARRGPGRRYGSSVPWLPRGSLPGHRRSCMRRRLSSAGNKRVPLRPGRIVPGCRESWRRRQRRRTGPGRRRRQQVSGQM